MSATAAPAAPDKAPSAPSAPIVAASSQATTTPIASVGDNDVTTPFVRETHIGEPITLVESAQTTVAVADVVTVKSSADTAIVTASPRVLITERRDDATPQATEDEPSDGVVRSLIATADTARLTQARLRASSPEFDGPAVKEQTGEIRSRPTEKPEPVVEETSIVITDLAAAHSAIAAVADAKPKEPVADAASPSRELAVSDVRRDAVALTAAEEEFFKQAPKTEAVMKVETFDDLDEGYEPPGFWDRVFGRKPKKRR